ncbi:SDR family NAD(P)-dependent oxidoreductase, partial [Marinitenerispora sediminis]|uniref:SDR family NAD(P)-dependent oxidoreductase n=1 Tax=Marinitenerispora sediminis TaxID=1931232 RepID=UPI001F213AFA
MTAPEREDPAHVLRGKVALVTGAGSGIGEAVARRVAARGGHVVVADIDAGNGRRVADAVGGLFVHTDVADPDANAAAVAAAVERHGRLDIAHLNAGTGAGTPGPGAELDVEAHRRGVRVNLDGVVFGAHAAAPALRAAGGGAILVTSSLAGLIAAPGNVTYAATKHAAIGVVRALALSLAEDGTTVNALCPGFVDTPMVRPLLPALAERGGTIELLTPDQVADAAEHVIAGGGTGAAWVLTAGAPPPAMTCSAASATW